MQKSKGMRWLAATAHESCTSRAVSHIDHLCDLGVDVVLVNFFHTPCTSIHFSGGCAVRRFHIPGMKGLFWKRVLTRNSTRGFDRVWLLDADVFSHSVNLTVLAERMNRVPIRQPAVYVTAGSRASDHAVLNYKENKSTCLARRVPIVEVMTPMMTRTAWDRFHEAILSRLTDAQLSSIWGLDFAWCEMFQCVVWYDQLVLHTNT